MARKVDEALPAGENFFETPIDELDEVLAGLPSEDSTVNLYRVNPQGKPAFITTFPARDFQLEVIKNSWGGGKYKYVAKSGTQIRQGTFEIEGEPIAGGRSRSAWFKITANGKRVFARPDEVGAFQVGNDGGDPIIVHSEPERTPPAAYDPLMFMMQELKELREEMRNRNTGDGDNEEKFLKRMALYKELFAPAARQSPSEDFVKNSIELLRQGIELGANAEGGGSPWYLTLFEKAMPMLQQVAGAIALQATRPNGTMPSHTVNQPVPVPTQIQPPPVSQNSPMENNSNGWGSIVGKLQPFLPTFLQAASRNVDPMNMVELTAANISPREVPTVISWLESDHWFTDLSTLSPHIEAQAAWWQDFGANLLNVLKNPEGEHDES